MSDTTPQPTPLPFHVSTVTIGHGGDLHAATVPDGGGVVSSTGLVVRPGVYVRGEDIMEALRRMPPGWTPEQAAEWFGLHAAPVA